VKLRILFGAGDKEGARLSKQIEAHEIRVAAIEQVKDSPSGRELVEEVDIVDLASGRRGSPHGCAVF
jgi:hypothetical protein